MKYRIEKANGTRMKWAVVDEQGYVVENFATRDLARAYLNRQPARKAEPQPTARP